MAVIALLVSLVCVHVTGAQRAVSAVTTVAAGQFRGTIAPVSSGVPEAAEPFEGSARWRFEVDSIDWRYKLTVRVAIQRPVPALLVVRGADVQSPPPVMLVGTRDPRSVPRGREHATASLVAGELGKRIVYERFFADTVAVAAPPTLNRGTVLRGWLKLRGSRADVEADGHERIITGEFAATFDPRPAARPATVSDSLQEAILRRALWDAGLAWQDATVHYRANDSTGSAVLLRGYLESRWSDAAIVEKVSTDYQHVSMRLRGRHAPVTCSFIDGVVSCASARSWWKRVRGHRE